MKKLQIFIILSFCLFSCRPPDHSGFYQPITLPLATPDGPPEYKAGWHAGCKAGLAQKAFANSEVYLDQNSLPDVGSGVYQHDKAYQIGFGQAIFACWGHMLTFVHLNANSRGPLE